MSDDLARMDATAQAELVSSGEASPEELLDAAIMRSEAVDPRSTRSSTTSPTRPARRRPTDCPTDRSRACRSCSRTSVPASPASPSTWGCSALKDAGFRAPVDTFLAERFRNAGLVTFGRRSSSPPRRPPRSGEDRGRAMARERSLIRMAAIQRRSDATGCLTWVLSAATSAAGHERADQGRRRRRGGADGRNGRATPSRRPRASSSPGGPTQPSTPSSRTCSATPTSSSNSRSRTPRSPTRSRAWTPASASSSGRPASTSTSCARRPSELGAEERGRAPSSPRTSRSAPC